MQVYRRLGHICRLVDTAMTELEEDEEEEEAGLKERGYFIECIYLCV